MSPAAEARFAQAGLGDTLARLRTALRPAREVAGWATVDLDRTHRALAPGATVEAPAPASLEHPRDALLGAIARLVVDAAGDVVLLEPFTEGRLAAALARHGEGVAALYLLADGAGPARARAAGFTLSPVGEGPFGPERLVVAGPRWGPYLLIGLAD